MATKTENQDFFGTEKIGKILLKIAPPVMLSQLIQALYNIVDSFGEYMVLSKIAKGKILFQGIAITPNMLKYKLNLITKDKIGPKITDILAL